MTPKQKYIEQMLQGIQTKLGHSCDFNYLNSATVTVENWESAYQTSLTKDDCHSLAIAFLRLSNLLEFNHEHKS